LDDLSWDRLRQVHRSARHALFPRIEKTEAIERMEAMEKKHRMPRRGHDANAREHARHRQRSCCRSAASPPEKIGIEDFAKVEMRVGQIKTAERIVGADNC